MSRAASIVERYTALMEKSSKYRNPIPAKGPGNPYHGKGGMFVSADDAVLASKHPNPLKKTGAPVRFNIKGWKENEKSGEHTPKFGGNAKLPAGPNMCGRAARRAGLDIRCHDGKVMGGHAKLKAAADKSRKAKANK